MMEGVTSEAASLAGHLQLGNLIYLYDDNHISIEGSTDIAFNEDVSARFRAYGWHVQDLPDVNDTHALELALINAKSETQKPSLIRVRSLIAYGSPNKSGTAGSHGSPLGADEIKLVKEFFGFRSGKIIQRTCRSIKILPRKRRKVVLKPKKNGTNYLLNTKRNSLS
jgi:transketolase